MELRPHFVVLCEKLDMNRILPYLKQDRMVTSDEYERLTNTMLSVRQKREQLLLILPRKGRKYFEHFGKNLVWSGQVELARHIGTDVDKVPPAPYNLEPEVSPQDQLIQLLKTLQPGATVNPVVPPVGAAPPYNPHFVPPQGALPAHVPPQPIHATPQAVGAGTNPGLPGTQGLLGTTGLANPQPSTNRLSPTPVDQEQRDSKVFILYVKDNLLQQSHGISADQFCSTVSLLYEMLRRCGPFSCTIDQEESAPQSNWTIWVQDRINESKFVIVVCSPLLMQHLSSGNRAEAEMEDGRFFSDGVINLVCAPKFIPVFLDGCEPPLGNLDQWIPPGLRGGSKFKAGNLEQFYNEVSPEGNNFTEEEVGERMSHFLNNDPRYQNLAKLVLHLRGKQGSDRPDLPLNPVMIHSPNLLRHQGR